MNWGVANPEPRRVLVQLQASGMLSQETIEAGSAPFVEMQNTIRDAIEQHIVRTDLPGELLSKMLAASAEATLELIGLKPATTNKYRNGGFEIGWAGIMRRSLFTP